MELSSSLVPSLLPFFNLISLLLLSKALVERKIKRRAGTIERQLEAGDREVR